MLLKVVHYPPVRWWPVANPQQPLSVRINPPPPRTPAVVSPTLAQRTTLATTPTPNKHYRLAAHTQPPRNNIRHLTSASVRKISAIDPAARIAKTAPLPVPAAITTQSLLDQAIHLSQTAPITLSHNPIAVYGSNTADKVWAQYVEDWIRKTERIGALNYPEEAKRQGLTGGPTLRVRLNADGSLQRITILRHAKNRILDEAAISIVKMSTPFAPFPTTLRDRYRALDIVRKWSFTTQHRLTSD